MRNFVLLLLVIGPVLAGAEPVLFRSHAATDALMLDAGEAAKAVPRPDYPRSCFSPGPLPAFEQSYVEGTPLFDYQAEVVDQQNPQALRAPINVRAWRAPCHLEGSALLIEMRPVGGLPLAPRVGVQQNEVAVNARISYEANTVITDDTGAVIPVFPGREEGTVYVVAATPGAVEADIDFDAALDLLIRHTFFDAVLEFPAYEPAAYGVGGFQPINPRHSGSWYNRARDGEGLFIEVFEEEDGDRGVFVSWYTYLDGRQQWLVGNAPLGNGRRRIEIPVVRTSGAGFGADFDTRDVSRESWGTLTLQFRSCDSLWLSFDGADGNGSLELSRLTTIADLACR